LRLSKKFRAGFLALDFAGALLYKETRSERTQGKTMILSSFPEPSAAAFGEHNVVPVGVKVLADTETPVSVLARFVPREKNLFLLESAEGDEQRGRYSFLGFDARLTATVYREEVVVRKGLDEKRVPHGGEPLAVLRSLLAPCRLAAVPGLPKCPAGLAGYFAYESVHFFEPRVPNKLPADRPLAELMMPGSMLVFDNVAQALYVVSFAFEEDGDGAFDAARRRVADALEVLSTPAPEPGGPEPIPPLLPTHGPEYYKGMVEAVKAHIVEGDLIQCVPSQSFVTAAPRDPVSLYRVQRHVNPSPYLYYFQLEGVTLVGSSPETMIKLDGRTACLRPIAGTRPRGGSEQRDRALAAELLADEKERAEHLMLVDLGRNELGRVSIPGTVQVVDLMAVERYSHVMHLVSKVVSELEDGRDAFDLFPSAFPAGTLTGAPKVRAMELIAELEDEPRGPYGGAVGYFAMGGDMDWAICIRTTMLAHGRLTARAGGGIVYDSVPETEYQETVNKAGAIARSVALLGSVRTAAEEIETLRKGGAQ